MTLSYLAILPSFIHRLTPLVFTKQMILDENRGLVIRIFVKKTGLDFKSEFRWPKQDLEYNSEMPMNNLRQESLNNLEGGVC
jgi:hypothetical protein